jgi:hypothetical protein
MSHDDQGIFDLLVAEVIKLRRESLLNRCIMGLLGGMVLGDLLIKVLR